MKKILPFLSLCLILSSCEKANTPRMYVEETAEPSPSAPAMTMGETDPHAGFNKEQLAQMLQENAPVAQDESPISWTVPAGWEEKAGNGMRLASFVSKDDSSIIDCSIVTLGAGAGGIEANIVRWLGQLSINDLSASELDNFVKKSEKLSLKNNIAASLFDFTIFAKDASAETPTMLVAIIDTPDQRIFVKMMGTKAGIVKNTPPFKTLVQSLEFHQ